MNICGAVDIRKTNKTAAKKKRRAQNESTSILPCLTCAIAACRAESTVDTSTISHIRAKRRALGVGTTVAIFGGTWIDERAVLAIACQGIVSSRTRTVIETGRDHRTT